MTWLDVFWACLTALALWTGLALLVAAWLGPLLARRAMQQTMRSMLTGGTTSGPVFSAAASNMPTLDVDRFEEHWTAPTEDDLKASGLIAEDK